LKFENNVPIKKIEEFIDTLDEVSCRYATYPNISYSIGLSPGLYQNSNLSNPKMYQKNILGEQWGHHVIKIPLAWEITYGNQSIYNSILEEWEQLKKFRPGYDENWSSFKNKNASFSKNQIFLIKDVNTHQEITTGEIGTTIIEM
jgi:hypothetical protein